MDFGIEIISEGGSVHNDLHDGVEETGVPQIVEPRANLIILHWWLLMI